MYCESSEGSSLNSFSAITSSVASSSTSLMVNSQSSDSSVVPIGYGLSRVPSSAAGSSDSCASPSESSASSPASASAPSPSSSSGVLAVTSSLNASSNASATTAKNTMTPTRVPTIDKISAAIPMPLRFPVWKNDTIESTNAMGNKIQPMMSAPGMQAKMKPTTATISAISPIVLRCGFCCCG